MPILIKKTSLAKLGGLFLILLAFSFSTKGQETGYTKSIVQYTDGSVFIGKVLTRDALGMTFLGSTGDTLHLLEKKIRHIKGGDEVFLFKKGKYHRKKGYFGAVDIGFALGGSQITEGSFTFGKRINNKYALGVGASLSTTEVWLLNENLWHDFHTYYAYGRYYLRNTQRRIFADMRVGYGFARNDGWNDPHSGGVHFQPGITVMFSTKYHTRFYISLSQNIQYTSGEFGRSPDGISEFSAQYDLFYNRTMLRFGLQFK